MLPSQSAVVGLLPHVMEGCHCWGTEDWAPVTLRSLPPVVIKGGVPDRDFHQDPQQVTGKIQWNGLKVITRAMDNDDKGEADGHSCNAEDT